MNEVTPTAVENPIEAPNSEESGNMSIEEIAAPLTPSEPVAVVDDPKVEATPVVEMFDLPDGRKVDAAGLKSEYEKLLPEFTRRSQELAALKNPPAPNLQDPPKNVYEDPNYIPQNFEEVLKVAEQRGAERALKTLEEREAERENHHKAIEDAVATQLATVKTADPNVNENALFLHATKYGFRDLTLAHANMKDMDAQMKKVQQDTEKNILKRNDPVSITPNAGGAPLNPASYASAVEYLRALKAQGQ